MALLMNGPLGFCAFRRTSTRISISKSIQHNALFSSSSSWDSPNPFQVFDRQAKLKQKARILRKDPEKSRATDYVKEEVSIGLVDRLMDIKRKYRQVVDLGSGPGVLVRDLEEYEGLENIIMTDASEPMLWRDPSIIDKIPQSNSSVFSWTRSL